MKAYMREGTPNPNVESTWKKSWKNASTSDIKLYLEELQKFLESICNSLGGGPYTFVSDELFEIIKSRPDYPEIEKEMKKVLGPGWELVPYKDADKKMGSGGDTDT